VLLDLCAVVPGNAMNLHVSFWFLTPDHFDDTIAPSVRGTCGNSSVHECDCFGVFNGCGGCMPVGNEKNCVMISELKGHQKTSEKKIFKLKGQL
jgi:hypothetical protein